MNARQTNKLNMYQTVKKAFEANPQIRDLSPALQAVFFEYNGTLASIGITTSSQEKETKGITIDKNVVKRNLCETTIQISGLVSAYASQTENNTLKVAVDYSMSDIMGLKEEQVLTTCTSIYKLAKENETALADYSIDAGELAQLKACIEMFELLVHAPRLEQSVRKTHTFNLKEFIIKIDMILKERLDKLVASLKKEHADFKAIYKNARKIVVTGARAKTNPKKNKNTPPPPTPPTDTDPAPPEA